jgi:hypothetical protein
MSAAGSHKLSNYSICIVTRSAGGVKLQGVWDRSPELEKADTYSAAQAASATTSKTAAGKPSVIGSNHTQRYL